MTDTHKMSDGPDTHKFGGGNPAFPRQESVLVGADGWEGMSLRQYAAIKLRVPNSGLPWLDEMIEKSNRDWFAGMTLQGIIPHDVEISMNDASLAASAYELADAMLKARGE